MPERPAGAARRPACVRGACRRHAGLAWRPSRPGRVASNPTRGDLSPSSAARMGGWSQTSERPPAPLPHDTRRDLRVIRAGLIAVKVEVFNRLLPFPLWLTNPLIVGIFNDRRDGGSQ